MVIVKRIMVIVKEDQKFAKKSLSHLVCWLEACVGDLGHAQRLVVRFLGPDHWGIRDQRKVDPEVFWFWLVR